MNTTDTIYAVIMSWSLRYAPQNGSATATYFERMAYIEHRFYEWVKQNQKSETLLKTLLYFVAQNLEGDVIERLTEWGELINIICNII